MARPPTEILDPRRRLLLRRASWAAFATALAVASAPLAAAADEAGPASRPAQASGRGGGGRGEGTIGLGPLPAIGRPRHRCPTPRRVQRRPLPNGLTALRRGCGPWRWLVPPAEGGRYGKLCQRRCSDPVRDYWRTLEHNEALGRCHRLLWRRSGFRVLSTAGLDVALARRALKRSALAHRLQRCHDASPKAEGRLELRLTLDARSRVVAVTSTGKRPQPALSPLRRCVELQLRGLRLPASPRHLGRLRLQLRFELARL